MVKINIILSALVFFFLIACKSKKQVFSIPISVKDSITNPPKESNRFIDSQDDSVYNLIESIKEVKDFIKKIDSDSFDHEVNILINQRPGKSFSYYWVQVGVTDKIRFQPVYNFYVNKEKQILYLNTYKDDTLITLKDWRRTRGW